MVNMNIDVDINLISWIHIHKMEKEFIATNNNSTGLSVWVRI
jgi:hypothetical protein